MTEEKKPAPSREEDEDIEDLRKVLSTVTEFMYQIKDLVKEFLDTLSKSFDGEKLGREVAQMYKSLVEAGMPPDKAYELAQRFLEAKLEAIPRLSSLLEMFKKSMTGGGAPMVITATKGKKPRIIRLGREEEGFEIKIEDEEEKEKEQ